MGAPLDKCKCKCKNSLNEEEVGLPDKKNTNSEYDIKIEDYNDINKSITKKTKKVSFKKYNPITNTEEKTKNKNTNNTNTNYTKETSTSFNLTKNNRCYSPLKQQNSTGNIKTNRTARNILTLDVEKINNPTLYNTSPNAIKPHCESPMQNFLSFHKISIRQVMKMSDNELQKEIPKLSTINNMLDDTLFYSDLLKLSINDNTLITQSNQKYFTRFCIVNQKEFRYFQSREKFIMLQNPIGIIELGKIKKIAMFSFDNKSLNIRNKKPLYNFFLWSKAPSDTFDIFASENEQIIFKWLAVINYFIGNWDE